MINRSRRITGRSAQRITGTANTANVLEMVPYPFVAQRRNRDLPLLQGVQKRRYGDSDRIPPDFSAILTIL
jgi:hypothetical protein